MESSCRLTNHSSRRLRRGLTQALGLMTVARTLTRWILLLAGFAAALALLNGAVFRAWIDGDPPNGNPAGWLFSAWNYVAWSVHG